MASSSISTLSRLLPAPKLYFDSYRLGQIRDKIEDAEPIIRQADMLSFDITSIKHADAPANPNALPNGLYAEEACQIMRYAGMSDKLTSLGIYELNPAFDISGKTSHLAAQMIGSASSILSRI